MAISTIGTDGLASSSVTSAKLASGAPSRAQLPAGTVLQVVQGVYTSQYTTTTTGSWVAPGMSTTITPTSATSKVLVQVNVIAGNSGGGGTNGSTIRITRNGSAIAYLNRTSAGNPGGNYISSNVYISSLMHLDYLDSPATTSSTTYAVEVYYEGGTNYGTLNTDRNNTSGAQGNATITLTEVAA